MGRSTRIVICLLLAFQLRDFANAARRVDAHVRARETLLQRRRDITSRPRREDESFSTSELFQLTQGESLNKVREMSDAMGTVVERHQETYNEIPVLGGIVTVRTGTDGQLTGEARGTLIEDIDKDLADTKPLLDDEKTLEIVIEAEGDEYDRDKIGDVKYNRFIYLDDDDIARVVNLVSYLIDSVKRPFYIIDVRNGEILKHWNGLNNMACERGSGKYKAFGGNEKIGKITYGDIPYCLKPTISEDGETCFLENEYVRVVDMHTLTDSSIVKTASFPCKHGYDDAVNGAFSPAVDAFFYGTVVGKMFEDWFETSALRDKIVLRVHYNVSVVAYWNGKNATFGDGGDYEYPDVALDIVGHEIAHGITEQTSDLLYIDESGGVNEAFSDIIGETAEQYLLSCDFMVGYAIPKYDPYLSEFEFPEKDTESIRHVADMKRTLNVHFSSGVFKRLWFVVVKQENMAIRDAAEVFLYANEIYWHETATFYDCSCGLLKSAMDLGYRTLPFIKAIRDVGIKLCDLRTHAFHLTNNMTQTDIVVSETVNPVFMFDLPAWASSLTVEAKTEIGFFGVINIAVLDGAWTGEDETNMTMETGETKLQIMGVSYTSVHIKLSADDLKFHFVDLTAGYTCADSYEDSDLFEVKLYRYYCLFESLWE